METSSKQKVMTEAGTQKFLEKGKRGGRRLSHFMVEAKTVPLSNMSPNLHREKT